MNKLEALRKAIKDKDSQIKNCKTDKLRRILVERKAELLKVLNREVLK